MIVLILVIAVDGLGGDVLLIPVEHKYGLNPCYSGRWSRRHLEKKVKGMIPVSLNPCYSGRWSRRRTIWFVVECRVYVLILVIAVDGLGDKDKILLDRIAEVLILVIAVDGLGENTDYAVMAKTISVLILVIAVDGLGGSQLLTYLPFCASLNPCYSGRWSRSATICRVCLWHYPS